MFQKYKIIDANAKHSIFLESVHLHSSKRVLIHKIVTTDSELLKGKLLQEVSNPDSISVAEYYQSEHALFVVLEDAYPLIQVIHNMSLHRVVDLFLHLLAMSRQNVKLFHLQLFLQGGKLKTYCLGGTDDSLSCLYQSPQLQCRFFGNKQKESAYIWNLGLVFLYLLTPQVKEVDYHRKYKATIYKLETLSNTGSKFQPIFHMIRCMLKYPPSERVSWNILQHSFQILLEQSQLQRSHASSKHSFIEKKQAHQQSHLLRNLLNERSLPLSKANRTSFICKSPQPRRKLKTAKSVINTLTGFPYKASKNQSAIKLQTKSTFKHLNYKELVQRKGRREEKSVPAKSFLQMIEDRRRKAKQSNSFIIRNQMLMTPPNQSFNSMNATQIMQEGPKQFQHFTSTSIQSTKRPSFRRNNRTQESQKSKLSKQELKDSLQQPRKRSQAVQVERIKELEKEILTKMAGSGSEEIQEIFETQRIQQDQKRETELFDEIQEYSESGNTAPAPLQQIEIKNVVREKKTIKVCKFEQPQRSQNLQELEQIAEPTRKSPTAENKQNQTNTSVIDQIRKAKDSKPRLSSNADHLSSRSSQRSSSFKLCKDSNQPLQTSVKQISQSSSAREKESGLPPKPPTAVDCKKMIKAFNLLGEVVRHANVNLKTQRSKWMVYCFLIYKCYWSFRMSTVAQLKKEKRMENVESLQKDNQNITLGFNSMYNVVGKVASNQEVYQRNKDIINTMQLKGEWKSRYISLLYTFFNQMNDVANKQRIHLMSKGKFKILLKFIVLIGVAILIIDEYGTEHQNYGIVDTYTLISSRLSETEEEEIIPDSFTQELTYQIGKILLNYDP